MQHSPLITPDVPQDPGGKVPKYSVSEIFGPTLQGEGALIGAPTHFVRFNGCDYRCDWCDSLPAVLPELIALPNNHTVMTPMEILKNLQKRPFVKMVTLSGGNPALIRSLGYLVNFLREVGDYEPALETQGSVHQEWFRYLSYLTLSPKPPSSKMPTDWDILRHIIGEYSGLCMPEVSLKVVVFDDPDIEYAAEVHERFPLTPFFVQCGTPQTKPAMPTTMNMMDQYEQLVQKLLLDRRFANTRILPQLHAWMWGHGRGF